MESAEPASERIVRCEGTNRHRRAHPHRGDTHVDGPLRAGRDERQDHEGEPQPASPRDERDDDDDGSEHRDPMPDPEHRSDDVAGDVTVRGVPEGRRRGDGREDDASTEPDRESQTTNDTTGLHGRDCSAAGARDDRPIMIGAVP